MNSYTKKYGISVSRSVVFAGVSSDSDSYLGDLTDANTYQHIGTFDCLIATQVLNFIFDIEAAIDGIKKMLKPGGVALITVAGCCQISRFDADRWGDYWRFTDQSLEKLFKKNFSEVYVQSYGNLASSVAFLMGLASEELSSEKIDFIDRDYQLLLSVRVKNGL